MCSSDLPLLLRIQASRCGTHGRFPLAARRMKTPPMQMFLLRLVFGLSAFLCSLTNSAVAQDAPGPRTVAQPDPVSKPNFVFLLLEGTGSGWASTSVAMDDRLPEAKVFAQQSPNLVRLAKEGMRLSDFYVSCPRCTPARAAFLTGMSAAKLGMTYVNEGGEERQIGRAHV